MDEGLTLGLAGDGMHCLGSSSPVPVLGAGSLSWRLFLERRGEDGRRMCKGQCLLSRRLSCRN